MKNTSHDITSGGILVAFHIVLVEPEIPYNTGNIARTCVATGAHLHLVRPLGFSTDDKYLKRAGMDYWYSVQVEYHDSLDEVLTAYKNHRFFFVETRVKHQYTDFTYQDGDFFVFGKESAGLPPTVLEQWSEQCVRLPMKLNTRSMNLSNTVAIVLYEALRQCGFPDMNG